VAPSSSAVYAEVMPDDADPGVEKFDVLAAITGEPLPAPPALPDAELIPPTEPAPAPVSTSSGGFRRPSPWAKHRHEVAALATGFVAVVWLSVGIAMREWTPGLLGVGFGVGALLIGAFEVWTDG